MRPARLRRTDVEISAADRESFVEIEEESERIAVRDTGLGIPPGDRERIFEKFFRLDPALARGVGGTSLGLYIVHELVERMGGSVHLESRLGEGSTFEVVLPV